MKDIFSWICILAIGFLLGCGMRTHSVRDNTRLVIENKMLRDSISKTCDIDSVTEVIRYEYVHVYHTDTLYKPSKTVHDTCYVNANQDSTFIYSNINDTCEYNIEIHADKCPTWVKMDYRLKDNFLIINTLDGIYVKANNGSTTNIERYTEKKKRLHITPQLGVGYGLFQRKLDCYVGVGLGVDL